MKSLGKPCSLETYSKCHQILTRFFKCSELFFYAITANYVRISYVCLKFQNDILIPWPSDYLPLQGLKMSTYLNSQDGRRIHQKLMILNRDCPQRYLGLPAFLNIKQPGAKRSEIKETFFKRKYTYIWDHFHHLQCLLPPLQNSKMWFLCIER